MRRELPQMTISGIALPEQKNEQQASKIEPPRRYKVMLINDDYTPMDFVVGVLQHFFHCDHARATQIMLQVHQQGVGVCGLFTRELAETKVVQVNAYARSQQYPLLCKMEPDTAPHESQGE